MPMINNYPNCCGAHVITGFQGTDEDCRRSLWAIMGNDLYHRRKVTFVLNMPQIRQYPLTLEAAANMGFVLAASWVNSVHDSLLFEFQRCGERVTLSAAAERIQWRGQILNPGLGGPEEGHRNSRIPPVPRINPDLRRPEQVNGFQAGDRVEVINPRNGLFGLEFTILRVSRGAWDRGPFAVLEGGEVKIALSSLRLVHRNAPLAPPPPLIIHQEPIADRIPRVIVLERFAGVYQDGRVGSEYPSLEALREANPRIRRYRQCAYFSDGTIEEALEDV